jgi:hypothetical protein
MSSLMQRWRANRHQLVGKRQVIFLIKQRRVVRLMAMLQPSLVAVPARLWKLAAAFQHL